MPLSEPTRNELATLRQHLLEMLLPLQNEDIGAEGSTERERLRRALWSAVREIDPLLDEGPAPADLDLTNDDAATREILYAFVVREYFSVHLLEDPGDVHIPIYTPEECGLQVFHQHGRWFVTWRKLEEDRSRPEVESRVLLLFKKDQDGRLILAEV